MSMFEDESSKIFIGMLIGGFFVFLFFLFFCERSLNDRYKVLGFFFYVVEVGSIRSIGK